MNIMYGIPNCDTIKKAKKHLEAHDIPYTFHDYKKHGIEKRTLQLWASQVGWELLLNKRGTTFRKLSDDQKSSIDESKAIALMIANPSMIKRPVLVLDNKIMVGFDEAAYQEAFTQS